MANGNGRNGSNGNGTINSKSSKRGTSNSNGDPQSSVKSDLFTDKNQTSEQGRDDQNGSRSEF